MNDGSGRRWATRILTGFAVLIVIGALVDDSSTAPESADANAADADPSAEQAAPRVERIGWNGPRMYTRLVSGSVNVSLEDCDNTHKLWTCTLRNNGRVPIDRNEFRSEMYDEDGVKIGLSRYESFPQDRVEPGEAIKVMINGYYDGSAGTLHRIKITDVTGAVWDPKS